MVRVGDPLIAIGGSRRCLTRTRGKILLILTVICSGLLYLSYDRLVSVKKPPHMRSRRSEKVVIPAAEPLLFPADYHARGVLSLPYGDIVEPFEVWHSATRNMSRIDYYGGMDRTYQRQDLGQYGFACKVVPEFSEKEHKTFKGCLHRRGTARFPVKTQSIVPSPSYFKYGGETEYKGSLHSKWEHSFTIYNKLNSYTLLTTKTRPAKPVRYEMIGYDTLLSSYYDHYILEYDVFEPWSFRYSNFQIPTNLRCFDFTSHRLAGAVGDINPMVEFMPHAESGAPYTLSHPSNHRNTPTSPSYSTTRPSVRPQNALEYLLEKLNQLPLVEKVATKKPTFAPYSARRTKSSQGQTSYRKKTAYKEKMRHYEDILNTLFDSFKGDFKKTYHTKHEHERRKNIYRHNIRNRQHLGYTLKPNHLTDMTEKEVEREKGLLKANHEALIGGAMFHVPLGDENRDPPETLDWRQRGAVNPVHSQGICGSCYAFAVTGAVEGAHFLKTGELLNLSEQQIIDCTWGFGNRGCKGGYPYRALQWIVKHGGLATEDSYGRYLAQEGYCHFKNTTIGAQMETFMKVTRMNTTEMKMALTFYGPVSILINTQPKSFKFYGSGVYYDPQCSHAYDHAALAVGYGVEKGVPYWLVKNSWSKIWGDQGYIKIAQKNDNCGVTQKAVAVKIKT